MRIGRFIVPVLLAGLLAGCPRPVTPPPMPATPTPVPVPTPTPAPTPPPPPYVPGKRLETGKIFNGLKYQVTLETEHGTTATKERNDADSYVAELNIKVRVPKPHRELAELSAINPKLPELFPALPKILEKANISPVFDDLYRLKVTQLRNTMNRLDVIPSRHNFYDTETILELQHPETKRKALLIQADMDVDEDGSDPERVPFVDGSSLTFQPMTSYRWLRKTDAVNAFIPPREEIIAKAKADLAKPGLSAERTKALKDTIADAQMQIADLKKHSFLVGAVDPFIVVPPVVTRAKGGFGASTGDFCVVVHGSVLFPAIIGDIGPAWKLGEASLLICKAINARSSSINRAESDLKVTYLIFPGTAERPFGPPDLVKWRDRCAQLLTDFGGTTGELHDWAPPPPPAPAPALPTPAPATPPPAQ